MASTWAAAPLTRITQTLCLALFLAMFAYALRSHDASQVVPLRQGPDLVGIDVVLRLDPLVGIAASLASRTATVAIVWAVAVLLIGVVVPRLFCGYVCPLGTIIDLWDWAATRRLRRFHLRRRGPWVHLRYGLLAVVLAAAAGGAMVAGYVSPIPLLTRGLLTALAPLNVGLQGHADVVPPMQWEHLPAAVSLAGIMVLGFLGPRFWCRCVCPAGALFSLAARLRWTERKVAPACVRCGRCRVACPMDAVADDFTTRGADCTFCQVCGGVCPVGAIQFAQRWDRSTEWLHGDPTVPGTVNLSRRALLTGAVGGMASLLLTRYLGPADGAGGRDYVPVRPPGSVPEEQFLRQCVRCGECMRVCPSQCLQPLGLQVGPAGLWTPHIAADWAGCRQDCNQCGHVCPTGAIRPLDLMEKRAVRMGLAVVNEAACLSHTGREPCRLCYFQCQAAGHNAIEFIRLHVQLDEDGMPDDQTGIDAPVVVADRCVGCGQCQARCHAVNVVARGALAEAAIVTRAGPGREDRLSKGSYLELREAEARRRRQERSQRSPVRDDYFPDFLK
jgi:polyferredoxin